MQRYESSVGGVSGVPAEILQGATPIPADRASVVLQGPANCTEDDQIGLEETSTGQGPHEEVQCAAALDGGLDDVGPIQLWDEVMKKYKLAQTCLYKHACAKKSGITIHDS